MTESSCTRRQWISYSALAGAALLARNTAAQVQSAKNNPWLGLKIGVASYSLRKMPTEGAIKAIQRVSLSYVSIKDMHLPLKTSAEERKSTIEKFKAADITALSCGVITMTNDEGNIRSAFDYARDCGIPTIVCNPHPDSMPLLDRCVKEFDIRLAIHNHGPEDKRYPSPFDAMKLIDKLDPRVGLCVDVGHTARAEVDPAEAIRKCAPRVYDIHLKDLNVIHPTGKNVEVGRGVMDVRSIMQALVEIKFQHHVGFEYEKDADDPLPGLAESVGYVRGVVAGLQ